MSPWLKTSIGSRCMIARANSIGLMSGRPHGPYTVKKRSTVYICSPGTFSRATWIGLPGAFEGANNEVVKPEWIAKNIQQGHGRLGAAYPDVAYVMEGDTPSYLSLIPNGLNEPERPDYGGWGGRYELYIPPFTEANWQPSGQLKVQPQPETRPLWTNAEDAYSPVVLRSILDKQQPPPAVYRSAQVTIWRWREAIQNDLAARMCWTTRSYRECNHPPIPKLNMSKDFAVKSGEQFYLDAAGSSGSGRRFAELSVVSISGGEPLIDRDRLSTLRTEPDTAARWLRQCEPSQPVHYSWGQNERRRL